MLNPIVNPDITRFAKIQLLFAATPLRALTTITAVAAASVVPRNPTFAFMFLLAGVLWTLWCVRTVSKTSTRVVMPESGKYTTMPTERLEKLSRLLDEQPDSEAVHEAKVAVYHYAKLYAVGGASNDELDCASDAVYERVRHVRAVTAGIPDATARFLETHVVGRVLDATGTDLAVTATACDTDMEALQRYIRMCRVLDNWWIPTRTAHYM